MRALALGAIIIPADSPKVGQVHNFVFFEGGKMTKGFFGIVLASMVGTIIAGFVMSKLTK